MLKLSLCAIAVTLMMEPTTAKVVTIRGAGMFPCSRWVKSEGIERREMLTWVLGFATAANLFTSQGKESSSDLLDGANPRFIEGWITSYCTKHPLKPIWKGSMEMLMETSPR